MNKRNISLLLAVLILLLSSFVNPKTTEAPRKKVKAQQIKEMPIVTNSAKVVRVIDGDTIEIETKPSSAKASAGKQKVRYIGVDTPELHDPRRPVQCFGKEAYEENKNLVEGKVVTLEKDVSNTDKYGRLLRYVYLPQDSKQTTSSGFMVNDYLVRQGFAQAVSYPPDIKYQDQFKNAQREAQENNQGLWNACK